MRIAYVTTYDPDDATMFSGATVGITRGLESAGATIVKIGPLPVNWASVVRIKQLVYRAFGRKHQHEREPMVAQQYARVAAEKIRGAGADVVLSDSSIPLAYLETHEPVAFWTDATFGSLVGYYPEFSRMSAETVRNGHALEHRALSRCDLALYTSNWAADHAIHGYGAQPSRVKVVPFGANIVDPPEWRHVRERRSALDTETRNLLFVGTDWERKGGAIAVEAVRRMNARGVPARLHVVGCRPPTPQPEFVVAHGMISKASPEGRRRLSDLFLCAHALVLPTRAECVANVFAEACCFGLPILTTDTGGTRTAVIDGLNGATLPLTATGDDFADALLEMLGDAERLETMSRAARDLYESTLNWQTAGHRVIQLLQDARRAPSTSSHAHAEPTIASGVV